MDGLTSRLGGLDSAKVGGLVVIGAVVVLALVRKGFSGVTVRLGD